MKKPSPGKSWFVTIPIALAASAYVWFFFIPKMRSIQELRTEMKRQTEVAHTTPAISDQMRGVTAQSQTVEDYIEQQKMIANDPAEISKVLRQIAESAKRSGVKTTRFVPEQTVKFATIERVPVRLGCRGTLPAVCKMLGELEEMHGHVWIDELSIEPTSETGEQVQAEVSLAIFVDNLKKSG